ncbi:HPP family protein [candidate division KSB1 bacterium]
MNLTANDFMTREVICVGTSTTLQNLVEILISKGIGGVPVIDNQGLLVGIISKTDLITHGLEKELSELIDAKKGRKLSGDLPDFDNLLGPEPSMMTVEQIMKAEVVVADKNTKINDLVKLMLKHRIHRIVIADKRRVIGIVTTMDILRLIDTDE